MDGPQPFMLVRDKDETGVSGTGVVAEGVIFSGDVVALRWCSQWPTSVVFHDRGIAAVKAVHGHDGSTRIVLQDEPYARLRRIADAHGKHVDEHGGTSGSCTECELPWPCPTHVWATTDRSPLLDPWDPGDDNIEGG